MRGVDHNTHMKAHWTHIIDLKCYFMLFFSAANSSELLGNYEEIFLYEIFT